MTDSMKLATQTKKQVEYAKTVCNKLRERENKRPMQC